MRCSNGLISSFPPLPESPPIMISCASEYRDNLICSSLDQDPPGQSWARAAESQTWMPTLDRHLPVPDHPTVHNGRKILRAPFDWTIIPYQMSPSISQPVRQSVSELCALGDEIDGEEKGGERGMDLTPPTDSVLTSITSIDAKLVDTTAHCPHHYYSRIP